MSRIRKFGGGAAGPARPGHPAGAQNPSDYPIKSPGIPGDLRSNLGGGTSPHTPNRTSVSLPGFSFAPEGAYPVDRQNDVTLNPGDVNVLIAIDVPQLTMLSIVGVGFDSFDPIALSFLTWSFLRAGQPDREYTNQTAVIGSVRELSPVVFFVGNQTQFQLVITLAAASPVPYTFGARVRGWFYSEQTG